MSDAIHFSPQGPPETVLPAPAPEQQQALDEALAMPAGERRRAVAAVVARWPRLLPAWAALGDCGHDDIERYAAYRVGYHRGLDALRQNGWRGSGYVRWGRPSNQGFLRCLAGLRRMAAAIGETDEEERIGHFLIQLEPDWTAIGAGEGL